MAIEAGKVLAERYRLIKPIGKGAQASVWTAEHLALSTTVAVKLIDPDLAKQKDARERFKREATAAAKLRSAHVVHILDHGIEDDQPYIVMEFLDGEDLFQRIERLGQIPLRETSKVITQVARALARAHAAGIIHRDLKPENVFLVPNEDEEVAKVLDFGVAKVVDAKVARQTGVGTLIGTPHYMSPEQVKGIDEVDARSDLWSLGIIAYQCVTGELPFDSEGVGDLLIKITLGNAPVPSSVAKSVPKAFDDWFAKACAHDPDKRFATARELAQALQRTVGTTSMVPRPAEGKAKPPPPPPTGKVQKKPPPPKARAKTLLDTDVEDAAQEAPVSSRTNVDDLDDGWGDEDSFDVELASKPPPPGTVLSDDERDDAPPPKPQVDESAAARASSPGAPPPLRRAGGGRTSDPGLPPPSGRGDAPASSKREGAQPSATDSSPSLEIPKAPKLPTPQPAATTPARPATPTRPANLTPETVTGLASSGSTMPPPPELDPSRRKRVIGWVVAAFVLLFGWIAYTAISSQMPPSGRPAATGELPPPPKRLPPPAPPPTATTVADDADAGSAKDPGAATKPTSKPVYKGPSTPKAWKTPPPTTGVPAGDDDDIVIEIPLPDEPANDTDSLPPAP